jgi:ribose transport system substrate-binding protein
MKKKWMVVLAVLVVCVLAFTLVAAKKKGAQVTGKEGEWVPYYMRSDFKPYVDLPVKTKGELGDVKDEMVVKPVDRVAPKLVKIGVIGGATNPFWDIIKMGVDAAAEELILHNVKVDWIVPGSTLSSSDSAAVLETLITKQYNGITLMIYNEGLIPYVEKAVSAGIPVGAYCVDTQPNKSLFFIGQDLYAAGAKCADMMAKEIGNKGKVAVITGNFNVTAHELRRKGFVDRVKEKYPGIKIVGEVENADLAEKARVLSVDFMTAHPDLAGIYVTAGGPIGSGQAVKEAGKAGKVKIIAFDPLPQTIEYIKDGSIQGVIGQNPYAEGRDTVIRLFNYMMEGALPQAKFMYTRADIVTIDSLEQFYKSGQKG